MALDDVGVLALGDVGAANTPIGTLANGTVGTFPGCSLICVGVFGKVESLTGCSMGRVGCPDNLPG